MSKSNKVTLEITFEDGETQGQSIEEVAEGMRGFVDDCITSETNHMNVKVVVKGAE